MQPSVITRQEIVWAQPPIGSLHDSPILACGERRPATAAPVRCPSGAAVRPAWCKGAADAERRRVEANRLHHIGTVDAIRPGMSAGPGDPHQGHPIRRGQAALVEDLLEIGIVLAGEDAVDRRQADVMLFALRDPPVHRIQGLVHVNRMDADTEDVDTSREKGTEHFSRYPLSTSTKAKLKNKQNLCPKRSYDNCALHRFRGWASDRTIAEPRSTALFCPIIA